ncbi:MAG TPA: helix-turn-helix domain-containing protein [Pyrinomonadaceae bacterium]|nr:helix-turn-helix domain-containing protein [Pyrinomonadaceae bacterium]
MDARLRQVTRLMSEDLSRPLDLKALARSVNLSPSRLRSLFREETGQTPAQYLKRLRMRRAEQLITQTFLNLKEVMLRVGISDGSHFVRDFRKTYGLPPMRYRAARGGSEGRSHSGQ